MLPECSRNRVNESRRDVGVYGRETLTKLCWYSEAETMDEEELSKRNALFEVEGSRRIQRP
jgi:hypothetical protein